MTLDDLIKAVEAVEAGDDDAVKHIIWGVASAARDKGQFFPAHDVLKAYHGSLDAAKDVHYALHPGVSVKIFGTSDNEWRVQISGTDAVWGPDPARAWLLAILKALQAEGRG